MAVQRLERVDREAQSPAGKRAETVRKVGHDLRNKLSVMRNSVYYLNMKVGGQDAKVAKHLGILGQEIETSTRTVCYLMDLLHPKEPSLAGVDINGLIQGVFADCAGAEIELVWQLDEALPKALVDAAQMQSVIETLWAYERAMLRPGDHLRIVSRQAPDGLLVEWIDNGPGLSAQAVCDICEPLSDAGTASLGLGMCVARQAVLRNGGAWQVESREGIGTRISLRLPLDVG